MWRRIAWWIILFGFIPVLALLALVAFGQGVAPSPQEQLVQCQNLLRVKTDMQGSAEQLAAALLKRAEQAEAQLAQLKSQAKAPEPPGESGK